MVALWELDEDNRKKGVKIARFEGCVTEKFPVYLTLKRTPEERVYVDGKNKPIAYNYTAQETTVANDVKDKFPLKITEDGGERLPENLMVNFTVATTRENIQPKETLGTTFGKIKKWFSDLKALAFKENVAKEDLADDLKKELDAKADKTGNIASATTATKATQDSEGNVIKDTYAKKTSLPTGVWRSNNGGKNSSSATTTLTAKQACTFKLKWLVSSESNYDKLTITAAGSTLVNAVSGEKNGTIAETALASGAAIGLTYSKDSISNSGRDLGEISDFYITVNGVLIAITPFNIDTYFTVTHGAYFFSPVLNVTVATTNLPGFMAAADKAKLDGIATGANNYTHPTNTARNGYPTANQTPGFGSTFIVGQVANDDKGHVTGITSRTVKIPDAVATSTTKGLMSAADKKQLTDFQIVGIYFIGQGKILYGFKSETLKTRQETFDGEKCLYITMPSEAGSYMILPFAPQSRHYLTTYEIRWSAGSEAIVFHRDPNGYAGYHNYGVGFMLIKTTLTLTA
ncbi:hypothetical protein HDR62_06160 [bacterium]|nr:hypothetical protein [bacterium]